MSHTCPIKDAKVALERLHKMLFDTRREAGIEDGDPCSKPVMSDEDAAKFATTLELNRSEWYDWCAVRHLVGDVEVEVDLVHKAVEKEREPWTAAYDEMKFLYQDPGYRARHLR